jgi:hypothetical protein
MQIIWLESAAKDVERELGVWDQINERMMVPLLAAKEVMGISPLQFTLINYGQNVYTIGCRATT